MSNAGESHEPIVFRSIGIIRSPHGTLKGMPIQPPRARDITGTVEMFEEYREGLGDLDGFTHLVLLYHFHESRGFKLKVVPFLDDRERGLFATRAPRRPNPIGLSVVRLDGVEEGVLRIRDVDILDGTPLLDIKPFVPDFDGREGCRCGWYDEVQARKKEKVADDRFV